MKKIASLLAVVVFTSAMLAGGTPTNIHKASRTPGQEASKKEVKKEENKGEKKEHKKHKVPKEAQDHKDKK